jgi:hypothetical protein
VEYEFMTSDTLTLQINVLAPPGGVGYCLQKGKEELVDCQQSSGEDLTFRVPVRLGTRKDGGPNFLGAFTQGPPKDRFIYLTIGNHGSSDHPGGWNQRAKVKLTGITRPLINECQRKGGVLSASFEGTAKDGTPACASVPLVDGGWAVVPA